MPAPTTRNATSAFKRTIRVNVLLPMLTGAVLASMVVAVTEKAEQPGLLLAAAVFIIALAFTLSNSRRALLLAVFCLPFTQVPTIKFFLRWRISELIAWLLLPLHSGHYVQLPRRYSPATRWFVIALFCYGIYTGVVGIAASWFVEVEVNAALGHFISPLFRTLLETARLLAALSLIVGLLRTIDGVDGLQRLLELLAWSGAVAGSYGIYQSVALWKGLPLLPETLWHEGYLRPFGTFYEPTGLGSFTAATSLLALLFLFHSQCKLVWLGCLFFNFGGLLFSLSRAGLAGFGVGLLVLWGLLLLRWRVKAFAICAMSSAIAVLGIGIAYKGAAIVMGEGTVAFALSEEWLWQTGQSRMDVYTSVPTWMMASLTGLGQGLYIFTGGGAPGFARLLVEGGVLGAIALLFLHAAAFRCLMHLWQLMATRSIVPFLAGAYVSSVVTTINYVNSTDMWIWCFWGLPAIAWQAVARHRQATV